MNDIANLASHEETTTKKSSGGEIEIVLTGADADSLRSFRKGKPLEKSGKALVESNGPRLKKLTALHRNREYIGIADAPTKFVLVCDQEVAKDGDGEVIKDKDGNPVIKPAAKAKVSIRTGSYTRNGFTMKQFRSMQAITHNLLQQAQRDLDSLMIEGTDEEVDQAKALVASRERQHEVWEKHFTTKVSIRIDANKIPRELLPDVKQLVAKMQALQVTIGEGDEERVVAMPAEAIDTTPVFMPKSTLDEARLLELSEEANSQFEELIAGTPAMIT